MIQTARPILQQVSYELGEETTDASSARLSYFNKAVHFYFSKHPWKFRIKSYDLTLTTSKEYDLTSLISDYDTTFGLYLVEDENGKQIEPIDFFDKNKTLTDVYYYLTPNKKSIGFTSVEADKIYKIYYYAVHINVSDADATLNIPIPEAHSKPIQTLILFHVYNRKRQRNDARNAMLDFKEELEDAIVSESKEKSIGNFPRVVPQTRKLLGL